LKTYTVVSLFGFGVLSLAACATAITPGASGVEAAGGSARGAAGSGAGAGGIGALDAGQLGHDNPDGLVPVIVQSDAGPVASEPIGACGASSLAAEPVTVEKEVQVSSLVTTVKPVSLYIMLDKSLSMQWSKLWTPAVNALNSFAKDDKSSGMGIGLQYFPISAGVCSSGAGYSTPDVPVGLLPAQASKLQTSLSQHRADGLSTPIEGALRGVTEFCKTYQSDHPNEQCVSVLVTDGKPDGCQGDTTKLAAIAKAAHDAGVTTFAVGLQGADFDLLDEIAKQGGAPDCDTTAATYACDVSSGADKLNAALTKIRDTIVTTEVDTEIVTEIQTTTLPCQWAIPVNQSAQVFDSNKVNIQFTSGGVSTTFVRAASVDACRADAWYYDDPGAPKSFIACPQTCEKIKAAAEAKIDVLLGCATLLPQLQ